ncbi:sugar transporter [Aspergillus stella-maris]|uniref:sugar transporter n=1 Tax=Aspergillus stella-maris TaxID=1810926 RepID=UPI003CCCA299
MVYLGLSGRSLIAGISVSTGMGFTIFGYDDGVIGGLLTADTFKSTFHLTSSMEGTVTALFVIGCLFGCLGTSIFGGRWGRLTIAQFGSGILSIGAILQASSYTTAQLIIGRIVAGVGLGLISSNLAVWQSELATKETRGMLMAVSLTFLILGQVLAYWIDYGLSGYNGSVSWRFPMAFQAFLGIVLSGMLLFMPESPRWLFQHDRYQEGTEVLRLLRSSHGVVDEAALAATVAEIQDALALEHEQKGWSDLLKNDQVRSRRRVFLACLLNACQAWSGSTPISYYTTVIMEDSVGFDRNFALLMSGFLQIWFLVASFGTWYTIEKLGRRRSFIASATGMASVMAIMAAMLAIDTHVSGIVAAAMLFAYQAFYTWGFMGGIWCYGPEILPLAHRSKGIGLATAFLWLSTFIVIEIVPVAIANIGWRTYIIFAAFNLAFVPMVYFLYPETAGFSLEAVDLAFMDHGVSPVRKSDELWRAMRAGKDVSLAEERGAGGDGEKGEGTQERVEHVEVA